MNPRIYSEPRLCTRFALYTRYTFMPPLTKWIEGQGNKDIRIYISRYTDDHIRMGMDWTKMAV